MILNESSISIKMKLSQLLLEMTFMFPIVLKY